MQHKLGLVLSGGGARAAAHIGALRALTEHGLKPTVISGASAGALVAALYG
ncbi:MAG: patatin-like phospholipase family protein, partial [Pseudomonadota bacterium]